MESLLTLLAGKAGTYLIGAGSILAVWLLTIFRTASWAKARERDKQRAKEADAYEQHLKDLERAAAAGAAVRPSDSLHDDPFNRDSR